MKKAIATPRSRRQPEADFDGAWKECLRLNLREFLEKYFPKNADLIDWDVPLVWLDKELSRIIGRSRKKARVVDLLVRVTLKSGDSIPLLLHIEVQTAQEANFTERLAEYNGGLKYVLHERVATLVILGDLNPDWMPTEDRFQFGDFMSQLQFPICKLVKRLESDWADDWSMPVILARAQIEALRTRDDPEARLAAKWGLIRRLYDLGLDHDQILSIYSFIDWMVRLRPELEAELDERVVLLEKERSMPHVTSMEKRGIAIGRKQGFEEGIESGRIGLLLQMFVKRFGELPSRLRKQLEALTAQQVDSLSADFIKLGSLSDLRQWLKAN